MTMLARRLAFLRRHQAKPLDLLRMTDAEVHAALELCFDHFGNPEEDKDFGLLSANTQAMQRAAYAEWCIARGLS